MEQKGDTNDTAGTTICFADGTPFGLEIFRIGYCMRGI